MTGKIRRDSSFRLFLTKLFVEFCSWTNFYMWQSFHTLCKCHFIKVCGFTEFGASLNISTTKHFLLRKHGQKIENHSVFLDFYCSNLESLCESVDKGKNGVGTWHLMPTASWQIGSPLASWNTGMAWKRLSCCGIESCLSILHDLQTWVI